jgi:hypothetical protein
MLGVYEHFPNNVHTIARFRISITQKMLQKSIVKALFELHQKPFPIEEVTDPSIPNCTALFEFGIAETNNFIFLDKEEIKKVLRKIKRKPFHIMDLFCAILYYKTQKLEKVPLKFDYYLIRLMFKKKTLETRVVHERGPRHMSPLDVVQFMNNTCCLTEKEVEIS